MKLYFFRQKTKFIRPGIFSVLFFFATIGAAQSTYPASIQQFIAYNQTAIAFTHCFVADVIYKRVLTDQTIIISKGTIIATGNSKDISFPDGTTIVDCTGKSVLPGYVLLHEHMFYPAASESPYYVHFKQLPVTFPRLYLACGITTIRTAGSVEPYSDLSLKRETDSNKVIGPTMFLTAPYMEGEGGFASQMHEIKTLEEAKKFVNFWADEGFTSFKAYMTLDLAVLKAAIETAHARGLKITGHLCAVTYRDAAESGIDQLEHGFLASTDFIPDKKEDACAFSLNPLAAVDPRGKEVRDLIALLIKHKVAITSTLAVFEGMCMQDSVPKQAVLDLMSADTREMYEKYYRREKSAEMDSALTKDMIMEKEFSDCGGLLTAGTDPTGNGSVIAGYGSLRAIELLTKAGFTQMEAIRIATYNGAIALGIEKIAGSIEIGKIADLVVIDGNIGDDINNIEKVKWVFHHGVGFDSSKILKQLKGQVGKY